MGPVAVVVGDVVDDKMLELAVVPDDGAVEEFSSDGADPSFSERVGHRRSHRVGPNIVSWLVRLRFGIR